MRLNEPPKEKGRRTAMAKAVLKTVKNRKNQEEKLSSSPLRKIPGRRDFRK